jgi:hypothetical protein
MSCRRPLVTARIAAARPACARDGPEISASYERSSSGSPAILAAKFRRTRRARIYREERHGLAECLDGMLTPSQWQLTESAAKLMLYSEELDAKLAASGALSEAEARSYASRSQVLGRTLPDLWSRGAECRGAAAAPPRACAAVGALL